MSYARWPDETSIRLLLSISAEVNLRSMLAGVGVGVVFTDKRGSI